MAAGPMPAVAQETEPAKELPAPVEVGIPHFLAAPQGQKRPGHRTAWVLIGALLACVAGTIAALKWVPSSSILAAIGLGRPLDLGLETYDINGAFLIRWDRDSSLIHSAQRATLEIQDGGEKTAIELSRAELAIGGCGYMRRTGQVAVHMRVEGPTSADEYCNFSSAQSLGSQQHPAPESDSRLAQALAEKEHLKTELLNESMQSKELRQEIAALLRQLAEERAKNNPAPNP
jgi:hypothetical protein